MKTAKETKETEDFKKYLTNARNKVSLFALSHISDVPTRTEIDSFVIAFDQLEERYYYLLKQLDASQSKWVRCAERLPETEGKYLVLFNLHHDGDAQCVAEFQYVPRHNFENPPIDKRWFVYTSGGSELRTITHWQPLPDKPVEK